VPFRSIHSEHFPQQEQKKKKGKQIPQLSEDYSDIVPCTTQQGIDFVPDAALEPVSSQLAVFLHMADDRFHRAAAPQLFFDCRCYSSALTGDEY